MISVLRQFRFLLPLVVVVFAAASAEAGFVSMADSASQSILSLESHETGLNATAGESDDGMPQVPAYLQYLEWDQPQFGNSPSSSGMNSGSLVSNGGSSAPAAILSDGELPYGRSISPLYVREIPFTPQSLIADIFRPPCA